MQPSVEDLFERWRSRGDSRALAALFDRTAGEVWRVARHLAGGRSEADDLLQTTFLAAIESASRWRREQPLVPWLLGILANKLRMLRRRERRQRTTLPRPTAAATREPIDDAAHTELRELMQQRLARLPETYRTVLVLQLEHGLSAAEVAHALGLPRATVRSQLHRGLELLRNSLPAGVTPPRSDDKPPDLRAVRGAVLLAAGVPATMTVPMGVTILMKKLLAVSVALLLGGAWFVWPTRDAARPVAVEATPTPMAAHAAPPANLGEATAGAAAPRTEVTPATEIETAADVVVHVLWSDGSPAAAMWTCLEPVASHDWFAQRWQAADSGGIARFVAVAPGSYRVRSRHGGNVDFVVAPATLSDIELSIPAGVDVRGTVVDPNGTLVPNAILVVGTRSDDALEATRSDGNGAFALRSVSAKTRIAAFADGFGGSLAVPATEFKKGPVELRLTEGAGVITGRVVDTEGRPIAGAWATHGYTDEPGRGTDGTDNHWAMLRIDLTNAAGEFRLQGVPLGLPWPLHVGAEGHAAWKGSVRAADREPQFVEVRLARSVRLHGVLRDPNGAPLRGFVHVVDANSPGEGFADQRPTWNRAFASTGDDGVFSLSNLAAGSLLAAAYDKHRSVDSRTFTTRAGDEVSWDPVLTRDLSIRGRLVDDVGAPLEGWRIVAHGEEGVPTPDNERTAADGTFCVRGCAPVPYKLRVYAAEDSWYAPMLTRPGVKPSAELLELRIDRATTPTCYVVGHLGADQPSGELAVVLVGPRGDTQLANKLQAGMRFQVGPVPPGTYLLQLQSAIGPGFCQMLVHTLGSCTLAPGQQHDFGELNMPPPGTVEVDLVDATGKPVPKADLVFALLGAPMGGSAINIRDGHGVSPFAPGSYQIANASDGLCIEHEAFVVTSGQRTTVHLIAAASVTRDVRFDLEAVGWTMRAFSTWRKNGQAVRRQWGGFWQEKVTTHDEQFTPGAWELELELGNGSVQRFPFVITGDDVGPTIDIKVTK